MSTCWLLIEINGAVRSSFYERVADAATAHAPQKEAVAVAVAERGEGGNKDGRKAIGQTCNQEVDA